LWALWTFVVDSKVQSRNSHAPFSIADPRAVYHEVRARATLTPSTPCLARWQSIVRRQRSPESRVGRTSLRNGTQSRAVRRPRVARSVVVPRFDCTHPPRMANFCGSKSACRLAFRVSSIPHWELGSAATGNRAASREGAGAEWLSQMSTTGDATSRHHWVRSGEGCTLLLCDGLVRLGTWMESTTYCLSGKEGFKAACTADMGEGLVGMAADGML